MLTGAIGRIHVRQRPIATNGALILHGNDLSDNRGCRIRKSKSHASSESHPLSSRCFFPRIANISAAIDWHPADFSHSVQKPLYGHINLPKLDTEHRPAIRRRLVCCKRFLTLDIPILSKISVTADIFFSVTLVPSVDPAFIRRGSR
jgi:hypothetical protein